MNKKDKIFIMEDLTKVTIFNDLGEFEIVGEADREVINQLMEYSKDENIGDIEVLDIALELIDYIVFSSADKVLIGGSFRLLQMLKIFLEGFYLEIEIPRYSM